jgi:hypothetical protein
MYGTMYFYDHFSTGNRAKEEFAWGMWSKLKAETVLDAEL